MRRPSPSLVVALLALALAAGGTSSIRNGAVTSSKVRDGTLCTRDFASGTLVVTLLRGSLKAA